MALTNRDARRAELAAKVSYLCMTDERFSRSIGESCTEASSVVVVALPDDSVHFVTDLLASAGGSGAVVVPEPSDGDGGECRVHIASVRAIDGGGSGGDWHLPVASSCSIGDLLATLVDGGELTYRLVDDALHVTDSGRALVPDGALLHT